MLFFQAPCSPLLDVFSFRLPWPPLSLPLSPAPVLSVQPPFPSWFLSTVVSYLLVGYVLLLEWGTFPVVSCSCLGKVTGTWQTLHRYLEDSAQWLGAYSGFLRWCGWADYPAPEPVCRPLLCTSSLTAQCLARGKHPTNITCPLICHCHLLLKRQHWTLVTIQYYNPVSASAWLCVCPRACHSLLLSLRFFMS